MTSIPKVKGKRCIMTKTRFCRALRLECRALLWDVLLLSGRSTMGARREHDEGTNTSQVRARSNARCRYNTKLDVSTMAIEGAVNGQ